MSMHDRCLSCGVELGKHYGPASKAECPNPDGSRPSPAGSRGYFVMVVAAVAATVNAAAAPNKVRVKCVDNHMMGKRLTVGKVYEASIVDPGHYYVVCDDGGTCNAMKERFVVEKDWDVAKDMAINSAVSSQREKDVSDWRTWAHKAPGECACGIAREQCTYHR